MILARTILTTNNLLKFVIPTLTTLAGLAGCSLDGQTDLFHFFKQVIPNMVLNGKGIYWLWDILVVGYTGCGIDTWVQSCFCSDFTDQSIITVCFNFTLVDCRA